MPIDFNALSAQVMQAHPIGAAYASAVDILTGMVKDPKKKELLRTGLLTGVIGLLATLLKKKAWTAGQYVLGERFLDHVVADTKDFGRGDVADEVVELAQDFFTGYFGVRITTSEDLDNLDGVTVRKGEKCPDHFFDIIVAHQNAWKKDSKTGSVPYPGSRRPSGVTFPLFAEMLPGIMKNSALKDFTISGVDLYYMRPEKDDIPQAAVERAVFLKAKVLPYSWYNNISKKIPVDYFTKYPLVAPLPGKQYNTINDVLPWFDISTNIMHVPANAPVAKKIETELKNAVAMLTGGITNNAWLLAVPAFFILYLFFSPKR